MWSREELESAYAHYVEVTQRCALSGEWEPWGDLFTEDVEYRVDGDLVWQGREAVRAGAQEYFAEAPYSRLRHFLFGWHVIDEERGWVVFEIQQRMDDPGDGSVHELPCLMRIVYGGQQQWSAEYDYYDPERMTTMVEVWQQAERRAQAGSQGGAAPASATAMTRAEREAFLADVHVGVLSIPQPGRGPLSAPIWYGYEPGGELRFTTYATSRKARLLADGVRVSLVAQTEQDPYRYVSAEGPVVAVEPADLERDERPLAHRYLGTEGGDRFIEATAKERDAQGAIRVRVRPERWLTVDYGKVDGGS